MEVDGAVTGLSGSCPELSFTVSGIQVVTDRDTDFKKLACREIRPGLEVKVKGKKRTDGVILAEKVEKD
jgi:uncharacterized protein DUF5666